jgi:carboxypeptidase C (cathepsin A)
VWGSRGCLLACCVLLLVSNVENIASASESDSQSCADDGESGNTPTEAFAPEQRASTGSAIVNGKRVDYVAHVGTLVAHLNNQEDVPQNINIEQKGRPIEASMFYAAYFKANVPGEQRPITFLYGGGPGSSTVPLHMGAFGPRRVVVEKHASPPDAYRVVNNDYSLLDASDLVFVDAPGTGFGRVSDKGHKGVFYGVDSDARAFADFIQQFIAKFGRGNSPKYLLGESYGTMRSATLLYLLESKRAVAFNGAILLSPVLNFDHSPSGDPEDNPGVDVPYELALPSYAATAWYHHRLPQRHEALGALLTEVEQFAMTDYVLALQAGAGLGPARRQSIVAKLYQYTGLPAAYIDKADLRVNVGEFMVTLLHESHMTIDLFDTRSSSPALDPLSKEAGYDPRSASVNSAYASAFNDYVRRDLRFDGKCVYKMTIHWNGPWNFSHQPPHATQRLLRSANVMPDLAAAMKYNPRLKIMVNGGYFDLATPYFEGIYEMQHLDVPADLQKNIEFRFYQSGHMIYDHEAALKTLHDNVSAFICLKKVHRRRLNATRGVR